MTAVVKKIGGSMAVVIPKAMATEMGLTVGVPLSISKENDSIVMRRRGRRPRRPFSEIVKQIKPRSYKKLPGWDDDAPIGREIW